MKASIKLGKVWGIPIGLHSSWFLIFALLVWSLGTGYFPVEYKSLSSETSILLAGITSLLFFGSVLAHELGHSAIALRNKIPVKGITLFIFGGVSQISQEPLSPGVEFRLAAAGPLTSFALGGLFGAAWLIFQSIPVLAAPSLYLMRINILLGAFNMIPGFPLDGGRVLHSIVWWLTKNERLATRAATLSGEVIAFGFVAVGLFMMFNHQLLNGIWLAFIGWFLQNAAISASFQSNMQEKLRGLTVAQAMTRDCAEVPGLSTLNQLVYDRVLTGGQHCFFATDYTGEIRGILTLKDITKVPQMKWRFTTAEQIMIPIARTKSVEPEMELVCALQTMDEAQLSEVPVIEHERLIGMLSRENVQRYLQLRTQLGV